MCCFSIFSSNFIDSKSGVTICNQSPIRRLDTWRDGARDHSTCTRPLGAPLSPSLYLQPFSI